MPSVYVESYEVLCMLYDNCLKLEFRLYKENLICLRLPSKANFLKREVGLELFSGI